MYADHFRLRCRPFEDRANTRFFFATSGCEKLLADLEHGPGRGKGVTLVLGEAGTGKTILIRTLAQRLHASDHLVVLTCPQKREMDFVRETCKGFGVTLPSPYNHGDALAALQSHLADIAAVNHRSLLVIDQAENLNTVAMGQLAALADLRNDEGDVLGITLVGRPRFRSLVNEGEFEPLSRQVVSEHTMRALTLAETVNYIQHRLRCAAAAEVELFDENAVALIHAISGGRPRSINHTCNAAMLAAYRSGNDRITRATVAEAANEQVTPERSAERRGVGARLAAELTADLPGTGPSAEPACDAILRDSRGEHPAAPALEMFETDGPGLLNRLERSLAQADRMSAASEASLARHMAVEKHLAVLTSNAEALTEHLDSAVKRASETLDRVQGRVGQLLGSAERRAAAVTENIAHISEVTRDAADEAERVERACSHAEKVEVHLTSFAEKLADRADKVQEGMTLLMSGLETTQAAQCKLQTTAEQVTQACDDAQGQLQRRLDAVASAVADADRASQAQRAGTREAVETCERFGAEFATNLVDECRERLGKEFDSLVEPQNQAIDAARKRFAELREQVSSVSAELETLRGPATENVIGEVRDRLREQLDTHQRLYNEAAEAAEAKLANLREQVSSVSAELETLRGPATENVIGEVRDRLREQLDTHQGLHNEAAQAAEAKLANLREQVSAVSVEAEVIGERFTKTMLTQHRDRLQEQLDRHRSLRDEVVRDAEDKMRGLRERVATASAEADSSIGRLDAAREKTVAEAMSFRDQFIAATLAAYRGKLEEQLAEYQRRQDNAFERAESRLADLGQQTSSVSADTEASFEYLRGERERIGAEIETMRDCSIEDTLTACRQRLQEQLQTHQQLQEEWDANADRQIRSMQERVSSLLGNAKTQIDAAVAEHRGSVQEILAEGGRQVDQLQERIKAVETPLPQVESVVNRLAHDLEDASGEVRGLSETVAEMQTSTRGLAGEAERSRADLAEVVQRGERLLPELQTGCGQAEAMQHSIAATLVDIGSAHERIREARAQTADSEQVIARLTAARAESDRAAGQLRELLGPAGELRETIHRVTSDADGKIAQLDSHNAAASSVIQKLAETNLTAHRLIGQANDATHAAGEAASATKEEVDRLVGDFRALTAKAEANAESLQKYNGLAGELVDQLAKATGSATGVSGELAERLEESREHAARIAKECAQAAKLTERVSSINKVMQSMEEADASVRTILEEARVTHDELATLTEAAKQETAELQGSQKTTAELLTTQGRLGHDTEAASAKLAEQVATMESNHAAGQRLLQELVAQSSQLARELDTLRRQATEIEGAVKQASAEPSQIIVTAKAQTAQLEQVCVAVRKVFAGLSKASLEAQRRIEEFHQTNAQTAERQGRLALETDRASAMLEEWIEEAVRAQTRLEHALDRCPSISETHSADALRRMSAEAPRPPRRAGPTVTGVSAASVRPKVSEKPREEVLPPQSARAREIADMIEDAKRAVR